MGICRRATPPACTHRAVAHPLLPLLLLLLQELAPRFTPDQVAWALSLVHSRSFIERGRHVWVPGIDLCNHTLQPNATIRRAASRSV